MKVHWSQLTDKQKLQCSDGCGLKYFNYLVPEFIFNASCRQHDFYYKRGGGLLDKLEADIMFYAHMLKDLNNLSSIKKWIYFIPATMYFVAVFTFGLLVFKWGRYRTLDKILKK